MRGTTIDVIGRYLHTELEVASQWVDGSPNQRGKLVDIRRDFTYASWGTDPVIYLSPLSDLLPVLYDHTQLGMQREDGVIPAVEIAKLCSPFRATQPSSVLSGEKNGGYWVALGYRQESGESFEFEMTIGANYEITDARSYFSRWEVYQKLIDLQFAVGLEPEQYVRKEVQKTLPNKTEDGDYPR